MLKDREHILRNWAKCNLSYKNGSNHSHIIYIFILVLYLVYDSDSVKKKKKKKKKKTHMVQFMNKKNIVQSDIWKKNSIKQEKTKNIYTAGK